MITPITIKTKIKVLPNKLMFYVRPFCFEYDKKLLNLNVTILYDLICKLAYSPFKPKVSS